MQKNGYDDIYIHVPSVDQVVRISEGTGDNLLKEDRLEGYVDYINYEQYGTGEDMPEVNGGMVMYKEYVRDKYKTLAESITEVLDMAYNDPGLDYVRLPGCPEADELGTLRRAS